MLTPADIPKDFLELVSSHIQNHAVSLFRMRDEGEHKVVPCGSGTFVKIEGRPAVLTASHVWATMREWEEVGLGYRDHTMVLSRSDISVASVGDPPWGEWGPDIAILELPIDRLGDLERRMTLYPLTEARIQTAREPPDSTFGPWLIGGFPGQISEVTPTVARTTLAVFWSDLARQEKRDGYDYLDFKVTDGSMPGRIPGIGITLTHFDGVSGGGLWKALILPPSDTRQCWDYQATLEGVVYWADPNGTFLRGHGKESIYLRLLPRPRYKVK